jgi:DNA-binding IclR family transcriptional regulator
LGRSLIRKGELARRSHSSLAAVQESVRRIAALTGDTAFYTERSGSIGICVWREDGNGPFRNNVLSVGDQHPLGIGAGSLAMLAALPVEEAARITEDNLAVYDEETQSGRILRSPSFAQALDEARSQGWAVNTGMVVDESWAVAVAVPHAAADDASLPQGALSVASVRSRLQPPRLGRIVDALRQEAQRLTAPAREDAS